MTHLTPHSVTRLLEECEQVYEVVSCWGWVVWAWVLWPKMLYNYPGGEDRVASSGLGTHSL